MGSQKLIPIKPDKRRTVSLALKNGELTKKINGFLKLINRKLVQILLFYHKKQLHLFRFFCLKVGLILVSFARESLLIFIK